jgi:hypothetical protein
MRSSESWRASCSSPTGIASGPDGTGSVAGSSPAIRRWWVKLIYRLPPGTHAAVLAVPGHGGVLLPRGRLPAAIALLLGTPPLPVLPAGKTVLSRPTNKEETRAEDSEDDD